MNIFSWKIGGPAGYGIKSTGLILAKYFLRQGLNIFAYSEYPSLVRGGHNTYQVEISDEQIDSLDDKINLLVALDAKTIQEDGKYLVKNGILVYDENIQSSETPKAVRSYPIPLTEIAKEVDSEIMRNTVALGASLALMNEDLEFLNKILKEVFKDKDFADNILAAKKGFEYVVEKKLERISNLSWKREVGRQKIMFTGNEAVALGAVSGECKFFSAYPMTPATAILHFLIKKQREVGMIVHQTEDEIAAIHAALGASFSGVRSMTATSGGGFALMNEGLSLAGMTETPLVLAEVMRPAPATGLPTWTDQGDLSYVVHAGHGDFPKVVIAPGDPIEAFKLIQYAFNIADKYQLPVIILSDKFLGESHYSVEQENLKKEKINRGKIVTKEELKKEEKFLRYKLSKDGVSDRSVPGMLNGEFIANSDEHNQESFSDETSENRIEQMDKRQKKIENLKEEVLMPEVFGETNANLTLVSWGSNKGPIIDAMNVLKEKSQDLEINFIHFTCLYPLPEDKIKALLESAKNLLLIENNQSGQFGKLLREQTGIEIKNKLLKYDGRPFWRSEIERAILENYSK